MLQYYHAELPYTDFAILACRPDFLTPPKQEALAELAGSLGMVFEKRSEYKDIIVYSLSQNVTEPRSDRFTFSGYLQHNASLHFGRAAVKESGIGLEQLSTADGYFSYAHFGSDATTISQDSFGRDIVFHYMTGECAVASNRCHLLLLFLVTLSIRLDLNYETVLSIMCSHTQFYQQSISRDMLFRGIQQMPMTDFIEINGAGWAIRKKEPLEKIFYPTDTAEYLFEKGLHEIRENTEAVFSRPFPDGLKVDVTGGYDSRITVAALMGLGRKDFECRTTANVNSNGDVLVGSLIAHKFGLKQGDKLFYPRSLWDSYEDAFAFQRSTLMGINYHTPSFGSSRVAPDADCFLVTGDWAEIYKPYFTRTYVRDIMHADISIDELADVYIQSNSFIYTDNAQLRHRLRETFRKEISLLPGEKAQEKFNNHLPFYRMRSHFGGPIFTKHYCNCRWAPASSKAMWAYCNRVPYSERYKNHDYDMSIRIANALCPEMETIPYAAPGATPRLELHGRDVTADYSIDTSIWQALQNESENTASNWIAETLRNKEVPAKMFFSAWQASVNLAAERTFQLFDKLAQYSPEMGEILNDTLLMWLRAQSACGYTISQYLVKLQNIWDQMAVMRLVNDEAGVPYVPPVADPAREPLRAATLDLIPVVSLIRTPVEFSDDLLKGIITMPSNSKIPARPYDALFRHTFEESPEENFLFVRGLDWLEALLRAYEETHNPRYRAESLDAIDHFIQFLGNDIESALKLSSSVEHGYATRSFILSRALRIDSNATGWKQKIIEILVQHAEWLADVRNRRLNNHDVMTNRALLHLSLLMPEHPQSPDWRRTALDRLDELLSLNFDADGMTNENTPGYHQFNLNLFTGIYEYLTHYGIECALRRKAPSVLEKATDCMRHLVRQDDTCPAIGDASIYKMPFKSINESCFYSHSGFCIIKDEDLYLSFKSGFGLESHKHHDETSITVFYKGVDLVVDGGRFNYDKANPVRQHMVSPKAHSAIYPTSLDDCEVQWRRRYYAHAGLSSFVENGSFAAVSGEYGLHDGTQVARHLCRIGNRCQIIDTWDNAEPQDMRQRFVLGPGARLLSQTRTRQGAAYAFSFGGGRAILFEIDIYVPHGAFESKIVPGVYSPVTHQTLDVLCVDTIQRASRKSQCIAHLSFSELADNVTTVKRYVASPALLTNYPRQGK